MKLMGLQCVFKLPEDFSGTLPAALRLMAKYLDREKKVKIPNKRDWNRKMPKSAIPSRLWKAFCHVERNGGRYASVALICESTPRGKWRLVPNVFVSQKR